MKTGRTELSELVERDLGVIWHPYTQMKDCEYLPPVPVERAQGTRIYDKSGKYYYDTIASWWCNVHGHGHPDIKKAIYRQLDSFEHVMFAGFTHAPAVELAERLLKIVPSGLEKVFFSDNGSTSVEVALKLSLQYWKNIGVHGRNKFLSLDMGYHGDTIGAMSVSGVDAFNREFKELFFDSYKVPAPYCYRCPFSCSRDTCSKECLTAAEKVIKEHAEEISAVILEPILLGAGGMIFYPADYLQGMAELCKRYGLLLIADEVATGFGRTGKMFACEHAGTHPDIMCLSKGITSGYLPLGVTLVTEEIYRAFYADNDKNRTFYHGHTYTANPLACSAAIASLELFDKEKTLEKVLYIEERLKELAATLKGYGFIGDVRNSGVVLAAELVMDKKSGRKFPAEDRMGLKVYVKGLENNLILRPLGDITYLFLPACVSGEELDEIVAAFTGTLEDVFS